MLRESHGYGWGNYNAVPFKYVCSGILAAAAEDEAGMMRRLTELVLELWQHSPEDLTPFVCMLRDQILSPTLQGVELLPAAQVIKLVSDSLAKTPEGVRNATTM